MTMLDELTPRAAGCLAVRTCLAALSRRMLRDVSARVRLGGTSHSMAYAVKHSLRAPR